MVGHHHQPAGRMVRPVAGGVGLHQGLHAGRGQRVDRAFIAATSPLQVRRRLAQHRHLVRADAGWSSSLAGVAGDAGLRSPAGQRRAAGLARLRERRPAELSSTAMRALAGGRASAQLRSHRVHRRSGPVAGAARLAWRARARAAGRLTTPAPRAAACELAAASTATAAGRDRRGGIGGDEHRRDWRAARPAPAAPAPWLRRTGLG